MLKVLKETEKAIMINLRIENTIVDKEFLKSVWIPKSQLEKNGMPKLWILAAKFKELYGYMGRNGYDLIGVEVQQ